MSEAMSRTPHLDVRLQDDRTFSVFSTHRATGKTAHAAPDDDDVVLALLSSQPVARALVDGLRVLPFPLRVVGEGHDLVARRLLRLRDVLGGGVQSRGASHGPRQGRQRRGAAGQRHYPKHYCGWIAAWAGNDDPRFS